MRNALTLMVAGILAAAPVQAAPGPEAKLAKALEGRVAGEPVDCIDLHRVNSSRIIDRTAIIYDTGGTLYVNRPRSGAESLDHWDMLVSRTFGNRLCSIDVVELRDRSPAGMMSGLVFLGEFVPYKKIRSASRN